MGALLDTITEFIKEMLQGWVMTNLDGMFTDVNDTYTMIANDEQTIIKHPNYCPNCGAKVVA